MKKHYCLVDKAWVSYECECNWCGEKEMSQEDKLGTLEEAVEFDKKRNYQYTAPASSSIWESQRIAYEKCGCDTCKKKHTTPRELSDEEIRQIYIETMESPYTHQQSYFGFARAILKKVSEK